MYFCVRTQEHLLYYTKFFKKCYNFLKKLLHFFTSHNIIGGIVTTKWRKTYVKMAYNNIYNKE